MIKTAKEALAQHLGIDYADLKEQTYQPGRYSKPVYTFNESYFTVTKGSAKPAQPTREQMDAIQWQEVKNNYVNGFGFKIWEFKS
jgi:hypothetical protein